MKHMSYMAHELAIRSHVEISGKSTYHLEITHFMICSEFTLVVYLSLFFSFLWVACLKSLLSDRKGMLICSNPRNAITYAETAWSCCLQPDLKT